MSSPPTSVTAAAALDAVQPAVDHTRRHLFPFRFERWVALGLVAFLDQCGRGGGGFNIPGPGGLGDTEGTRAEVESGLAWLAAHAVLVSLLAAVVLALAVAVTALVLWINSRGVFMYIDDVASGRSGGARPWPGSPRSSGSCCCCWPSSSRRCWSPSPCATSSLRCSSSPGARAEERSASSSTCCAPIPACSSS